MAMFTVSTELEIVSTTDSNFTTYPTSASTTIHLGWQGFLLAWPTVSKDDLDELLELFKVRIRSYKKALFKTKLAKNHLTNQKINHNNFHSKRFSKRTWHGRESIVR